MFMRFYRYLTIYVMQHNTIGFMRAGADVMFEWSVDVGTHGCGDCRGPCCLPSTLKGPVGMQGHSWDSAEERLTLCSTILLQGEGPLPNLTAGRHSQACGKANARGGQQPQQKSNWFLLAQPDTDSSGPYNDSLLDTEGNMSPQCLRRTEEAAGKLCFSCQFILFQKPLMK